MYSSSWEEFFPPPDIPKVKAFGVAEVFGPGTSTATIVDYVRERLGAS